MHNCHVTLFCASYNLSVFYPQHPAKRTTCIMPQQQFSYLAWKSVVIRAHGWAVTVRVYGISRRGFALCRLSLETHPLCRGLRQVGGLSGRRLPEWSYPRMHGGATSSYLLCTTHIHRVFNEQISRYGPAETRSVSLCNVCRMSGLHRHLPLHAALPPSRQICFSLVPYGFNAAVAPASPVHFDRQVISSYGYLLVNILS